MKGAWSRIWHRIPKLPLSALLFYLFIILLWQIGLIPNPEGILSWLEGLYREYGLPGLFTASFLEGIVYLGLYFPGSFVVALAVILSDGSFGALLHISLTVSAALTLTSIINYSLGRRILRNELNENLYAKEKKLLSKGMIFSLLHPNSQAFYFFNAGIRKHNFFKVLLVPVILIPYGLLLGRFLFAIKGPLRSAIESPYLMISYLLVWMLLALLISLIKESKKS